MVKEELQDENDALKRQVEELEGLLKQAAEWGQQLVAQNQEAQKSADDAKRRVEELEQQASGGGQDDAAYCASLTSQLQKFKAEKTDAASKMDFGRNRSLFGRNATLHGEGDEGISDDDGGHEEGERGAYVTKASTRSYVAKASSRREVDQEKAALQRTNEELEEKIEELRAENRKLELSHERLQEELEGKMSHHHGHVMCRHEDGFREDEGRQVRVCDGCGFEEPLSMKRQSTLAHEEESSSRRKEIGEMMRNVAWRSRVQALQDQLEAEQVARAELKGELEEMTANHKSAKSEASELKKSLQKKSADLEATQAKLTNMREVLELTQKNQEATAQQLEELKEQLSEEQMKRGADKLHNAMRKEQKLVTNCLAAQMVLNLDELSDDDDEDDDLKAMTETKTFSGQKSSAGISDEEKLRWMLLQLKEDVRSDLEHLRMQLSSALTNMTNSGHEPEPEAVPLACALDFDMRLSATGKSGEEGKQQSELAGVLDAARADLKSEVEMLQAEVRSTVLVQSRARQILLVALGKEPRDRLPSEREPAGEDSPAPRRPDDPHLQLYRELLEETERWRRQDEEDGKRQEQGEADAAAEAHKQQAEQLQELQDLKSRLQQKEASSQESARQSEEAQGKAASLQAELEAATVKAKTAEAEREELSKQLDDERSKRCDLEKRHASEATQLTMKVQQLESENARLQEAEMRRLQQDKDQGSGEASRIIELETESRVLREQAAEAARLMVRKGELESECGSLKTQVGVLTEKAAKATELDAECQRLRVEAASSAGRSSQAESLAKECQDLRRSLEDKSQKASRAAALEEQCERLQNQVEEICTKAGLQAGRIEELEAQNLELLSQDQPGLWEMFTNAATCNSRVKRGPGVRAPAPAAPPQLARSGAKSFHS
eukprot:TRINITY_DN4739_c0_g1_i2.p1 TRINITY_DN4739_c0_g1~~TRINITY_DN4739_c0_g1_i2.p1  ORF type:complete len:898 (+),score=369.86 TRINITY_DN4739_c0_g1_i2:140-2833(+)